MEIKVDTKKDSAEDIGRAIEFLQKFIEKTTDEPLSEGAFNLFSDNNNDSTALTNNELEKEEDSDDDINIKPAIEPY